MARTPEHANINTAVLVPIAEVAARCGVTVDHIINWVGPDAVYEDWAKRQAITVTVAAKLVADQDADALDRLYADLDATQKREHRAELIRTRTREIEEAERARLLGEPRNYLYSMYFEGQPAAGAQAIGLDRRTQERLEEVHKKALAQAEKEIQ